MSVKDILPSSGGSSSRAGFLPWMGSSHKQIQWATEFISTWISSSAALFEGTHNTAFLHDMTLTYLLPVPLQLERREIDF